MTETIIIIACITLVGAFVQGLTGFGFSIIAISIMPLILPVTHCIIILLSCSTLITGFLALRNIRYVNVRLLIVPLIFSLIGSYIGLTLLFQAENGLMTKLLGAVLVLLAAYFFFFANRIKIPNNQYSAFAAGLVSGVLGGLFNVPGPPMVLYYSVALEDKRTYYATLQTLFFFTAIFKLGYYILRQGIPQTIVTVIPYAAASSVAGMLLGFMLFKKLCPETIKKLVYIMVACFGLVYLIR